ncbi:hypothetical protein J2Z31_001850 [Sinorhizobium kostiense]|uniref:Uncharacterized protein n=1 Tax=Sinorhizobium kostiense TaxID=76747 RepID=A0ABS4QXJ0_9HYPH|nr:hypothetical protein [Sinorhizobium kostiense]MBP2235358.1 hypothetical protein [Sinorhizobium kostiense]
MRTFTSTEIDEAIEHCSELRDIEELGLDGVEFHQKMEAVYELDRLRADLLNVACRY